MAKGIAIREVSPTRTEVRQFLIEAERKTVFGKIATHRPTFDRQMEEIVTAELRRLVNIQLPPLLSEMIGDRRIQVRYGKTAAQIWKDKTYPSLNLSGWFGNQLAKGGCLVQGAVYGELGHSRARLFDPDKVDQWLAAGGKDLVKLKISEALGQGHFTFVYPEAASR